MLDKEGYRPNVGIILTNSRKQVFWGKRIREHSWQFPQGGIKHGESPEQAMYLPRTYCKKCGTGLLPNQSCRQCELMDKLTKEAKKRGITVKELNKERMEQRL